MAEKLTVNLTAHRSFVSDTAYGRGRCAPAMCVNNFKSSLITTNYSEVIELYS